MAWYWWVLIGIGAVIFVGGKMYFVPRWFKKQAEKKASREKLAEDDK